MTGILIAGAGYTGRRVAQSLQRQGCTVTVASRRPPAIAGTTPLVLDVDDPTSADVASRLAHETRTLVYLVPPDRDAEHAEDTDRRLARLLEALEPTLARVVLASTSGVYGDHAGGEVTEHTPVAPRTTRAKARVGAERTLARFAAETAISYTILRIAGIYGPDRLMIDALEEGRPLLREADAGPGNRIHVDDLALAFVRATLDDRTAELINVSDGNPMNSTRFALHVASMAGLPAPPQVDLATAQETFSPMRLSFLNESRRIRPDRLHQLLGDQMRYQDPIDGIRDSLAAMDRLRSH